MPKLIIALLLIVAAAGVALIINDAKLVDYLTAVIAVAALVVSIISSFKEDIFPFRPGVLLDEVLFAATTAPSHNSPAILLPLAFVNEGYGAGVIEGLTLKLETGASAKIFTPVAEIDYGKFISGRRALHADNTIGAFNIFTLSPRATTKKCFLFTQEEQSTRYPFSPMSPGKHVFRLYLKHTASAQPVEVGSITHEIDGKLLSQYASGTSCSLSPSRELHV